MHRAVSVPTSSKDGSLVLSADLHRNGKQNRTAKTSGRIEAVVYVRIHRLKGHEIARQGNANGARNPHDLDRRRASSRSKILTCLLNTLESHINKLGEKLFQCGCVQYVQTPTGQGSGWG